LTRYVVDASVVIKWFLPEVHTEAARRLLKDGLELSSPDLVRAEFGNVMWKRWRRGDLSAEAVDAALRSLGRLPLRIESSASLMGAAWDVARRFERSFYDGLYVALATQTGCPLVTADRKLYNSLRDGELARRLMWVEDLDPGQGGEDT
jgi:predicted nucleic acid-binding protein